MPPRIARIGFAALAFTAAAYGQAAVEYALKSSGGALSEGGAATIGTCPVDSSVISCLGKTYPGTSIIVFCVLILLVVRWMARVRA